METDMLLKLKSKLERTFPYQPAGFLYDKILQTVPRLSTADLHEIHNVFHAMDIIERGGFPNIRPRVSDPMLRYYVTVAATFALDINPNKYLDDAIRFILSDRMSSAVDSMERMEMDMKRDLESVDTALRVAYVSMAMPSRKFLVYIGSKDPDGEVRRIAHEMLGRYAQGLNVPHQFYDMGPFGRMPWEEG